MGGEVHEEFQFTKKKKKITQIIKRGAVSDQKRLREREFRAAFHLSRDVGCDSVELGAAPSVRAVAERLAEDHGPRPTLRCKVFDSAHVQHAIMRALRRVRAKRANGTLQYDVMECQALEIFARRPREQSTVKIN